MVRRRYLVAYDICDDRRLRRTFETMKGFGYWLQYSVFVCDLDDVERMRMLAQLTEIIHHGVDSVVIVDLGDPRGKGTGCFSFLGVPKALPTGGPVVV